MGTHPFTYAWQLNNTNLTDNGNIFGSGTASLTIGNVTALNAGVYTVVVSNALGTVTSSGAALNLTPVTAPGVTLNKLFSFSATGSVGDNPYGPLLLVGDGSFYGTTTSGSLDGYGAVFRLTTNGAMTLRALFNYNNDPICRSGAGPGWEFLRNYITRRRER